MKNVVVFITVSNREEGERIGRTLVEEKLVACVNLFPGIFSMYWWQGKIETANEVFCMAKTGQSLVRRVIKRVKELHSYSVPEVIALPIVDGNPDYLKWIGASTGKGKK